MVEMQKVGSKMMQKEWFPVITVYSTSLIEGMYISDEDIYCIFMLYRALSDADIETLLDDDDDDVEFGDDNDVGDDEWLPGGEIASDAEIGDVMDEVDEQDSDEEINASYDFVESAMVNTMGSQLMYDAPDGTQWSQNPSTTAQTRTHNILRQRGQSMKYMRSFSFYIFIYLLMLMFRWACLPRNYKPLGCV